MTRSVAERPEMMRAACPLCAEGTPSTEVVARDGFQVVECTGCGLVRMAEHLSPGAISTYVSHPGYGYGGELDWNRVYTEEELSRTAPYRNHLASHRRLKRLLANAGFDVASPLRVHEIGCSEGFALFFGRREGWRFTGNDLSPVRHEFGVANLGVDFPLGHFSEIDPGDLPLDAVLLRHVLEHLPDPIGELKLIRERLAPRGVVLLEVPNWAAPELRLKVLRQQRGLRKKDLSFMGIPEHIWQFTAKTLPRLCATAGYTVAALETSSHFSNHTAPVRFLIDQTIHRFAAGTHLVVLARRT